MSSSLSQGSLTALAWVFSAAAIALTIGRYVIRVRTVKKLKLDDYFRGFLLVVMIGYMITYTVMFPLDYSVEFFVAGLGPQPSRPDMNRYFHLEIAVSMMFWVVIYSVKFTFLIFYREIFGVSKTFLRVWWAVASFTFGTFWACFLSVLWACGTPLTLFVVDSCLSPSTLSETSVIVTMWCVLNIISDLSIIFLPLWMLRGLRISTAQKIGLAGIFSIALADTVFDVTRTIYTVHGGAVALDTTWDILEPAIAVIASTLPSYRSILTFKSKKRKARSYNILDNTKPTGNSSQPSYELKPYGNPKSNRPNTRSASEENIFNP